MRPRLPRAEDTWTPADCESVRELARAYAPSLVFAENEQFFPVLAESWLSHTSYGPWPSSLPSGIDNFLVNDERQRGTALVRSERDGDDLDIDRLAGAPNPNGRPLQFGTDQNDLYAIGRPSYRGPSGTALDLVFGGWTDDERTTGDREYIYSQFSEFADAMNPTKAATWRTEPRQNWATKWVPQPPTPTVYAEVDWTGRFPAIDEANNLGDFAPAPDDHKNRRLDSYLQISYYYFFPMREPADSDADPGATLARCEGQWQAATVIFETNREYYKEYNDEDRPEGLSFREEPVALVLSHQQDGTPKARTIDWDDVERFPLEHTDKNETLPSTSPIIYVGKGTHTFLHEPVNGGNPYTESGDGGGSGTSADDLGTEEFTEGSVVGLLIWMFLAIVLAVLASMGLYWALTSIGSLLLAIGAAVVLIAILVILLVIFIVALLSLIGQASSSGDEPHQRSENEEATGDGAAATPPASETDGDPGPVDDPDPSGGHDDPTRTGSDIEAGGYPSGVGDHSGSNAASFDVRVVDRLNEHDMTDFPPEPGRCERPTWWQFSGRWGIPVSVREDAGWTSGQRRIDGDGRSWAYWHAVAFDTHLSTE